MKKSEPASETSIVSRTPGAMENYNSITFITTTGSLGEEYQGWKLYKRFPEMMQPEQKCLVIRLQHKAYTF